MTMLIIVWVNVTGNKCEWVHDSIHASFSVNVSIRMGMSQCESMSVWISVGVNVNQCEYECYIVWVGVNMSFNVSLLGWISVLVWVLVWMNVWGWYQYQCWVSLIVWVPVSVIECLYGQSEYECLWVSDIVSVCISVHMSKSLLIWAVWVSIWVV